MMSQTDVAVVRAALEAWNQGDMDAVRESLHAEVVARMPEGWPEPGPFVGPEAAMHQWQEMRDVWDIDVLEPIGEFIDTGDRIAVRLRWRGHGHGLDSSLNATAVYTLWDQKVIGIEFFWDHTEALQAAGFSE